MSDEKLVANVFAEGSVQSTEQAFPRNAGPIGYLVKEYVAAREKSKEWEVQAGHIAIAIMRNMDTAGVPAFQHEGISVSRVLDGLTSRLDKKKLMALGVPADTIERATVQTKRSGYVRVETPEQKAKRGLVAAGMLSD